MSKGIIYFSKFNIDSCFAALIVRSWLQVVDHTTTYQIVHYDRSDNFTCPTEQTIFFLIGADISPIHLAEIIEINPECELKIANYENSEKYRAKIKAKITTDLNKDMASQDGLAFVESISSLVNGLFSSDAQGEKMFNIIFPNVLKENFIRLIDSIGKYTNYQLMTKEDVLFMYKNIENIRNQLFSSKLFEILMPDQNDEKDYFEHVRKLRVIIKRNFSRKYYTVGLNSSMIIPTLAVSEELASDVIRLISYSYDDVVTYEDTAYFRVYRIHSETNMQWFIKSFKPIDVWSEGNLTFVKTTIPQQDR